LSTDDDTKGIAKRRESMAHTVDNYGVPVDTVGEQVVSGILNDELYIFCDGGESRNMVERRNKAIMDAFNRQLPKS